MTGKTRHARSTSLTLMEEEWDDMTQTYKNRLMVHDIHRVRELSALLEERRKYFDGQLGEVYRNAGVSSPSSSLPRLRGLNSPPMSASPSESNMTNIGILGHSDHLSALEIQSGRSYSVFADDECSIADSFDETKARLGRKWSSSTLLGANTGTRGGRGKFGGEAAIKDSIQNEVMRTAYLEKKLKARRSSLPLALEASLKRPLKKKTLTKTNKGSRKDKLVVTSQPDVNLQTIAASLLTKPNGYPDSSDGEQEIDNYSNNKLRRFSSSGEKLKNLDSTKFSPLQSKFSMTETLNRMRKFDVSQDLKRTLGGQLSMKHGRPSKNNYGDKESPWDSEIVGGAPRVSPTYKSNNNNNVTKKSATTGSSSKSISSTLAPILDYSPRSSLSTVSGSYPRIAFSSLEKVCREDLGDKAGIQPNPPSHLLWKMPVPKTDANIFPEPVHTETDYSHDFRYLSLLDALVPCFEPSQRWDTIKPKKIDNHFSHEPYERNSGEISGLSRLAPY